MLASVLGTEMAGPTVQSVGGGEVGKTMIRRLPSCVTRELGFYVYLYIDPRTERVFYVGKGKGNRALSHVDGKGDTPHDETIRELHKGGVEPRVEILIHGLEDEKTALAVEMAAIELLGPENLDNEVRGHGSSHVGRMILDQILSLYQRKPARITEPAILIRITRNYRYGMTPAELYDHTRGEWVVGPRREKVKYAFAVFHGIVREVYLISQWLPSGSTFSVRGSRGAEARGKWEFVGIIAPEGLRKKYLGRAVDQYFSEHAQNPIQYVNC